MTLLNKTKAAEILGVSEVSVDRYRRLGLLPYRRFGGLVRFAESDIDKFLERTVIDGSQSRDMERFARGGKV